jgi:hypothetical protein
MQLCSDKTNSGMTSSIYKFLMNLIAAGFISYGVDIRPIRLLISRGKTSNSKSKTGKLFKPNLFVLPFQLLLFIILDIGKWQR